MKVKFSNFTYVLNDYVFPSLPSFSAARDRLSDLTSRDGDWFLDELYTMSGNVSQMIGLLDMCLIVSNI